MSVSSRLLGWYRKNGRNLPWRRTRDPYRILVSEIMLQQTQVPRVLLFYKSWLKRFPDWKTLARASNADVIRAWAGLGYNRRALVLRDIAREVAIRGVPKSEEEWRTLKGVGPYTAAALACFSLHERAFPIDTVIRRTAGRILLGKPFPDPKQDGRLRRPGLAFLSKAPAFYDVPQAVFDLGTVVCKKVPDCAVCPLRNECKAAPKFLSGRVRIPKAMIKKARETKHRDKPYPDRIYRGRILQEVRNAERACLPARQGTRIAKLGKKIDPTFDAKRDTAWLRAMIERMQRDGMIKNRRGRVRLVA